MDLQRSAALAFSEITELRKFALHASLPSTSVSLDVEKVESAVLEPLLHLLQTSNDAEVQRATSAALGNLAVNIPNKLKIVQMGGLEPLITQMNSSNVEVQCNAVGCITNLATHEDNKLSIARSGALLPLTKLAQNTKDIRVQRNATGALLNMTHSEVNRRALVEVGAIPVLVQLLKSPDVDVVYYCATALSNLAVDGGWLLENILVYVGDSPCWRFDFTSLHFHLMILFCCTLSVGVDSSSVGFNSLPTLLSQSVSDSQ